MEPTRNTILNIDGSLLEGGGQILRISSDLSFLLQRTIKVSNIRAGRSNPGLQNQHLTSLEFLVSFFKGTLLGGKLNSQEIQIIPNKVTEVPSISDCKLNGAGSIGLMIQVLMPCLIFVPKPITINFTGGTDCAFSPSISWLNDILFPLLEKHMNVKVDCELIKHGLFPRGGGKVKFTSKPIDGYIKPIDVVTRGKLEKVKIIYYSNNTFSFEVSAIEKEVMKPIRTLLRKEVFIHNVNEKENNNNKDKGNEDEDEEDNEDNKIMEQDEPNLNQLIEVNTVDLGKGAYTFSFQMNILFSNTIMSCVYMYSSKKEEEKIISKISQGILDKVEHVLTNPFSCFDDNVIDQLLIYMCLAKGKSRIAVGRLPLHALTGIEVIKLFLPSIDLKVIPQGKDDCNIIEIDGIGLKIE